MDNNFTKEDYQKAARMMRGIPELDCFKKVDENDTWIFVSDLLENAITNIEIIERLRKVLEHIINPIKFLRIEAEKEGLRIDGMMASMLSDDANYLKELAKEGLEGSND